MWFPLPIIGKRFYNTPSVLSIIFRRRWLNNSRAFSGPLLEYSFKWYLTPRYGVMICNLNVKPALSRYYFLTVIEIVLVTYSWPNDLQLTFRYQQQIFSYKCILQNLQIRCCSFPPSYNICEFHVKITSHKYILCCLIFSSTKTRSIQLRDFNMYMSTIYSP